MMVYSDQLMLIDEFQHHFDRLWTQTGAHGGRHRVIDALKELRDQCAKHINNN